ncbi:uncharacterized protein IAS62_006222 [Cryptococcus decagattii]|uniref:Uncharacterized protein n=1 Tax=Cryptococcus decagattii TaxID=1859122 RepID=A0ABZ2B606_9TREE
MLYSAKKSATRKRHLEASGDVAFTAAHEKDGSPSPPFGPCQNKQKDELKHGAWLKLSGWRKWRVAGKREEALNNSRACKNTRKSASSSSIIAWEKRRLETSLTSFGSPQRPTNLAPDHCAYTGDLCRQDVQQYQKSRVHWKEEVEERVNNKDWETCGAGKEAKRDDRDRHCQAISISIEHLHSLLSTQLDTVEISTFLKILVVPLSRIVIGATVAIYPVSRS